MAWALRFALLALLAPLGESWSTLRTHQWRLRKAPGTVGVRTLAHTTDTQREVSDSWELDCYSRPVVNEDDGKKHVEKIPANKVNSREVKARVRKVVEDSPVRPREIRFFRKAMYNMLNIALTDVGTGINVRPSRNTYTLYQWLEDREKTVYPNMPGYKPTLRSVSFMDIQTPEKLPDALRADQFAFVSLPLSEITQGGVNKENIGAGKLCPVPEGLPEDAMVQGILFLTSRAEQLANWLAGSELAHMKADLKANQLVMDVEMSTSYLVARLNDIQRVEAQAFESGKAKLGGIHFVGVQADAEDDEVAGFWLLRQFENI